MKRTRDLPRDLPRDGRPRRSSITAALLVMLAGTPGCARRSIAGDPLPPDLAAATSQSRCTVRRSADKPLADKPLLIVEWPAADRAALEARARQGLVAVRYAGCTMEVLSGCDVDGRYAFVPTSRKQERVTIRDESELYARLPVGAASLQGTLARQGQLMVDMTIVGLEQADRHVISRSELHGHCEGATHVLTGLTVGAFSLYAGAGLEAGARAQLGAAGAGAAHARSREILARDGDPMACDGAPVTESRLGTDAEPPPGCEALLRVEAVPLADEPAVPAFGDARSGVRRLDRGAAWRGTAIASGVISGASFGGILGGIVLLFQSQSQPVWEDISPENARKKSIGTGMLVGSSIGFVAFGALALGASAAAQRAPSRRYAWFAPMLDRHTAGLGMAARF